MAKYGVTEIKALKEQVDKLSKEISKAEGMIASAFETLEKLDCSSVKEANTKLKALEKEHADKKEKLQECLEKIKEELDAD